MLEGKYSAFLKDLRTIVNEQEVELKTVTESFRNKESQISQLQNELRSMRVEDDKDNYLNINKRLTELMDTLVEIEKKRRTS